MAHLPRRMPPLPETPPVKFDAVARSETEGMPPACEYTHTPLPDTRFLPRLACANKILFQICWLMMVHSQVSPLSGGWSCSWQPIWRQEQSLDGIWQPRRELTEGNRIYEYYHYLLLADNWKYILKGIFICIIQEQCNNKGKCTWILQNGCHKTITDILCQVTGSMLRIRQWQNKRQQRFNNVWLSIMVTLRSDWSQRCINVIHAAVIVKQ